MTQRTDEELRADIRRQVIESRRRQGLPDTIEDPIFLGRIAAILLESDPDGGAS
jgi:hypothetical protein